MVRYEKLMLVEIYFVYEPGYGTISIVIDRVYQFFLENDFVRFSNLKYSSIR